MTSLAEPVVELFGFITEECRDILFPGLVTNLISGQCTNLESTKSFQLNPAESCEIGKSATVLVFNSRKCESFADVHYPTDENKDVCYTSDGTIKSAKFICQDVVDDAIVESELKAK